MVVENETTVNISAIVSMNERILVGEGIWEVEGRV